MKPLVIKEASSLHKVLLALRAGPLDVATLMERFPSFGAREWTPLVKAGYANVIDGVYSITQAGREACPGRRDISAKAQAKMPKSKGAVMPEDTDVSGITTRQLVAFIRSNPGATREQVNAHFAPGKRQYAKRHRLRQVIYYTTHKAKTVFIENNGFFINEAINTCSDEIKPTTQTATDKTIFAYTSTGCLQINSADQFQIEISQPEVKKLSRFMQKVGLLNSPGAIHGKN